MSDELAKVKRKVTFQVTLVVVVMFVVSVGLLSLIPLFTLDTTWVDNLLFGAVTTLALSGAYFICSVVVKTIESIMDDIRGVTSLERFIEELSKEVEREDKRKGE